MQPPSPREVLTLLSWENTALENLLLDIIPTAALPFVLFLLFSLLTSSFSDCVIHDAFSIQGPPNSRQSKLSMTQQIAGRHIGHGPNSQLMFHTSPASVAFLLQRRGQSPWASKSVGSTGTSPTYSLLWPSWFFLLQASWNLSWCHQLLLPQTWNTRWCSQPCTVSSNPQWFCSKKIHPSVTARYGFACISANQM